MTSKLHYLEPVPELIKTEAKESCHCKHHRRKEREERINNFRLTQWLGCLPTRPEAKVVGKHEYIRIENVNNEPYPDKEYVPTVLDVELSKLSKLKASGRTVLGFKKEWGGVTIKTMAQRQ